MAELADALDLGSSGVTREGSSPSFRIAVCAGIKPAATNIIKYESRTDRLSPTKKNLDIEIPQDVVDHEIPHIAQEFARSAEVPGFRPGKAPIQVVKTRIGTRSFPK